MAAPCTSLASFHSFVNCKESLAISENNDIAICTDDGFYILEHKYSINLTDYNHHFNKCFIPCSKHINIPKNSINLEEAQQRFTDDELKSVILDRTILPASLSQSSFNAFCGADWSPPDAGIHKRCVLAGLSYDHRLTIYISKERNDYQLLHELSEDYYEYCRVSSPAGCRDDLTFNQLKEEAYRTAAVEIAWSSTLQTTERFSFLVAAMKNGDLVVWKALHPVISRECFTIYKIISTGIMFPSAVAWFSSNSINKSVYLGVGYQNGVIKIININIEYPASPTINEKTLHRDEDMLSVSTLCWKIMSNNVVILISAKGEFILTHVLKLEPQVVHLIHTGFNRGRHTLEAKALSCRNGEIILSSADGSSWLIEIDYKNNGFDIQIKPVLGVKHTCNIKWTCHGGCITTNGVFYISIYSPSGFYDHLKYKFPLSVHIVPLKDIQPSELPALLSSNKVDLMHGGDVLDIVRRNLHLEYTAPEKTYIDYKTIYKNYLDKQSTSVLQAWRYILMIILTIAPEKKDEEFDDSEIPEKCDVAEEIKKITCLIMGHHIQKIYDKSKTVQLFDKDLVVLEMMLKWMKVNLPDHRSLIVGLQKLTNISTPSTDPCIICNEKYSILQTAVQCSNGHQFGLCCQTLEICTELPFISCVTCGGTALSIDKLQDYACLAEDSMRCTLCCSPLS